MLRRLQLALWCALLVAGCRVDRSIDPTLILTGCTANADCPGSQTCQPTNGFSYCTATSPAFSVTGPALTPDFAPHALIGPKSQLRAVFSATAAATGHAFLIGPGGTRIEWTAGPNLSFLLEGKKVEPLQDGLYTLFSYFQDGAGHLVTGAPVAVEVDRTAPVSRAPRFTLTPAPGTLAAQFGLALTAAGPATTVTAQLLLDEALGPDTRLELLGPDAGRALAFTATDGGLLELRPPADPALPQGPLAARLTLADRVGNTRSDVYPGVTLDTRVPSLAAATSTLALAPWGLLDDPTPVSRVTVDNLPEPGELFVFQGGFSVGHAPVGADAGVALALLQSTPPFDVALVDPAGNESPRRAVSRLEFTFTPRDIDPTDDGRVLELRANQVAARLIPNPSLTTQPPDGGLVLSSTGAWRARPTKPSSGSSAAVAFDADREVAVAFGGLASGSAVKSNATLEWQGQGWFPRDTPVAPAPANSDEAAMAYDALREVVLLFNGLTAETWSWNGNQWKRINVPGSGSAPGKRTRFAMAFDKRSGNLVLFGGERSGGAELNDTWVWNGLAWREVTPKGLQPEPRGGHVMAFHPPSGGVVMFGDDKRGLSDVWWWDGRTETWTLQALGGVAPGGLAAPAMAFDDNELKLQALDLKVGKSWALTGSSDGGALSGFAWAANQDFNPPDATGALTFFDSARRTLVVSNAESRWSIRPDAGTGPLWSHFKTDRQLEGRRGHALAWNQAADTFVMFGGLNAAGAALADPWCFSSEGWQQMVTDAGVPPPRWGHTLTPVSPSKLVLNGGFDSAGNLLDDTWQFGFTTRGCAGQWTRKANQSPRAGHAAASDTQRLVVWDGDGGAQWQDVGPGGTWTPLGLPLQGGPGMYFSSAAYDPRQGRIIGAGGGSSTLDCAGNGACRQGAAFLTADAGSWSPLPPLPAARKGLAVWFDAFAGTAFTFGGVTLPQPFGQPPPASLARLTPVIWSPQTVADVESDLEPAERGYLAAAYSLTTASALMFGGGSPALTRDDTWDFKIARQRPAVVFHVDLNRFVFKPFPGATFTGLVVDAVAGGQGFDATATGATPVSGAGLQGYLDGRWQVLADAPAPMTTAQPPASPGRCRMEVVDRLDQLLIGSRRLSVAVTPLGESADQAATLRVDRLAVKLSFELPP